MGSILLLWILLEGMDGMVLERVAGLSVLSFAFWLPAGYLVSGISSILCYRLLVVIRSFYGHAINHLIIDD
jgi:hypothetical protein